MILINSSPKDALKIFQSFLPVFLPIGPGFLLAALENAGIDAAFIDEQIDDNIFEMVASHVKKIKPPYIFGFSVLTKGFKNAVEMSQKLKKIYPESIIIFGGVHPSALPEESLAYPFVDIVVRGEGEEILVDLYKLIKAGKDYTHLKSLSYKKDGVFVHNELLPILKDINGLPRFPYHRFVHRKEYDTGILLTSRGCPHKCNFCSNRVTTGLTYRFRDADAIVDDLDLLYNKYGKRRILVVDDNFTVNKRRLYELVEAIKKRGFDKLMSFSFQARGDNVDPELLKSLYDVGFHSIFLGVETASEKIIADMKKDETVAENVAAAKMAKAVGMNVRAAFIFGYAGETHEDRMNAFRLSKELKLDWVRYNNATPYPGTELYEIAKNDGGLHVQGLYENFISVSPFVENPFNPIPLPYLAPGITAEDLRTDMLLGYLRDYLNWTRIKGAIRRDSYVFLEEFNPGESLLGFIKKLPALCILAFWLAIKFGKLFLNLLSSRKKVALFADYLKVFFDLEPKGKILNPEKAV